MSDTTLNQEIPMLTVDGSNYPISSLPEDVRELISVYQGWEAELKDQKVAVFKTEAALRACSNEIQTRVRTMLMAAQESQAAANDAPPAQVEQVVPEGGTVD